MIAELNDVVKGEMEQIITLNELLKQQQKFVLDGNLLELEAIVKELNAVNINIASMEMKRRKITGGKPMSEIVAFSNDEALNENYRKIKSLLSLTASQKDININQLKQKLNFTNSVLKIINPDRTVKTYNSYGKLMK